MHPSNRPSPENLTAFFTYLHAPRGDQIERYEALQDAAKDFGLAVMENCPDCADRSAAIRKIREAVMVANASIALEEADE